jgi:hypothetical protein
MPLMRLAEKLAFCPVGCGRKARARVAPFGGTAECPNLEPF